MFNILVVEDDIDISRLIKTLLIKKGYNVVLAFSGTEALLILKESKFDLVLLDLMLLGLSGEEVLTVIDEKFNIPIICVSAKTNLGVKIDLIQRGADDYITKPFDNEELLARVGAVLRRSNKPVEETNIVRFKDLTLDKENHIVSINNTNIDLTFKEYAILELLISNPKKVFSKKNIFEKIWNEEYIIDERAVVVHISNLRTKLRDDNKYIRTVWGIGYKMDLSD